MARKKDKIVYTGGTFDLFHYGHVNFLKACSKLGKVVVALNSDRFVKEFKRPTILNYQERRDCLLGCKYVHKVVKNKSGRDSKPTILKVKPDIVAIGDDWATKDYYSQMQFTQDWLDLNGIVLTYLPYKKGISSTQVRERVLTDGKIKRNY